jgi:hypothetical protein
VRARAQGPLPPQKRGRGRGLGRGARLRRGEARAPRGAAGHDRNDRQAAGLPGWGRPAPPGAARGCPGGEQKRNVGPRRGPPRRAGVRGCAPLHALRRAARARCAARRPAGRTGLRPSTSAAAAAAVGRRPLRSCCRTWRASPEHPRPGRRPAPRSLGVEGGDGGGEVCSASSLLWGARAPRSTRQARGRRSGGRRSPATYPAAPPAAAPHSRGRSPRAATIARRPCLISAVLSWKARSGLAGSAKFRGSKKPPGYRRFSGSSSELRKTSTPPISTELSTAAVEMDQGRSRLAYWGAPASSTLAASTLGGGGGGGGCGGVSGVAQAAGTRCARFQPLTGGRRPRALGHAAAQRRTAPPAPPPNPAPHTPARAPGLAGHALGDQGAEHAEHRPAAVDELSLAEALEAEHLAVGREAGLRHDVRNDGGLALDVALEVLGRVDVVLVHADLHKVRGAGEAQGVEAAVAGQGAVQPLGAGGVGQPQGVALVLAAFGGRGRAEGGPWAERGGKDRREIRDRGAGRGGTLTRRPKGPRDALTRRRGAGRARWRWRAAGARRDGRPRRGSPRPRHRAAPEVSAALNTPRRRKWAGPARPAGASPAPRPGPRRARRLTGSPRRPCGYRCRRRPSWPPARSRWWRGWGGPPPRRAAASPGAAFLLVWGGEPQEEEGDVPGMWRAGGRGAPRRGVVLRKLGSQIRPRGSGAPPPSRPRPAWRQGPRGRSNRRGRTPRAGRARARAPCRPRWPGPRPPGQGLGAVVGAPRGARCPAGHRSPASRQPF